MLKRVHLPGRDSNTLVLMLDLSQLPHVRQRKLHLGPTAILMTRLSVDRYGQHNLNKSQVAQKVVMHPQLGS